MWLSLHFLLALSACTQPRNQRWKFSISSGLWTYTLLWACVPFFFFFSRSLLYWVFLNALISQRICFSSFYSQTFDILLYISPIIFHPWKLWFLIFLFSGTALCFSSLVEFWVMWNRDEDPALVFQVVIRQVIIKKKKKKGIWILHK